MKIYKIKCDVYNCELEFWVGITEKEFVAKMKKLGEDVIEDGSIGMYLQIKEKKSPRVKRRIIWLEKYPKKVEDRGVVVHELLHAISSILSYKNIRLVLGDNGEYLGTSEESFAYMLEFFYREFFKILK